MAQPGLFASGTSEPIPARGRPPRGAFAKASPASVRRIPDDGKHAVIVLTGGATEIGVELGRPEFRRRERKAHVVLA